VVKFELFVYKILKQNYGACFFKQRQFWQGHLNRHTNSGSICEDPKSEIWLKRCFCIIFFLENPEISRCFTIDLQ